MISVKFVFKRGLGCLLNVYQGHWAMTCAMHEISSLINLHLPKEFLMKRDAIDFEKVRSESSG